MTHLTIKNMVCRHCVAALAQCLDDMGLEHGDVELGGVDLPRMPSAATLAELDRRLETLGFVRAGSAEEALVERTKTAVRHHVRSADHCRLKLSACISDHVGVPYDSLSRIFSRIEGRTLENYAIAQRIEFVKELMSYGERTLTEIAYETGYSSAAHLSRQFKSVTGMTPSEYLRLRPSRRPLDEV